MSAVKERRLKALEGRIHYQFKDKSLALVALTHSSYGDGRRKGHDNERLEFLGDRVLGLMTAEKLYHLFVEDEGTLARRLNALVRKETCAKIARKIGLGEALFMSSSEERQGGRDKMSILGDACESLLAAIYLDGGIEAAWSFFERFWSEDINIVSDISAKDPKTSLQELASSSGGGAPVYSVQNKSGPDHRPLFVVEVSVERIGSAVGTGKSKKDAERFAAMHLLENWPKSK